jgi:hypothetical protein
MNTASQYLSTGRENEEKLSKSAEIAFGDRARRL